MKNSRQTEIVRLVREREIETQAELASLLMQAGFSATQATISRDIRELKLYKTMTKNGRSCYAAPGPELQPERYRRVLKESVVSVTAAKSLIVIRTVPGMAMAAAAALDEWHHNGIAGCIAGDDTIFCAMNLQAGEEDLINDIQKLLTE